MAAVDPSRVWFFGGNLASPDVQVFSYNTANRTFSYVSNGSTDWNDTVITAASKWYNDVSGQEELYLFDGNTNVCQVAPDLHVSTNETVPEKIQ